MSRRPEEGSHLEQIMGFYYETVLFCVLDFFIAHVKDPKSQHSEECIGICGFSGTV